MDAPMGVLAARQGRRRASLESSTVTRAPQALEPGAALQVTSTAPARELGAALQVTSTAPATPAQVVELAGWLWNKGGQKESESKKDSWRKGKRRNWKKRYFTQAGRTLCYHESSEDAVRRRPPLGRIDLALFELREREPTVERQWAFTLASADKDYPLCANSAEEKRLWMESIRRVQVDITSLRDGGGPVLVSSSNSRMELLAQHAGGGAKVSEGLPPTRRRRDDADSSDEDDEHTAALGENATVAMDYIDYGEVSAAERQRLRTAGSRQVAARQGWLLKQGDKRKHWGKRYFVLSQHQLAYYREEPGIQTEARGVFDLTGFAIEAGADPTQMSFVLRGKGTEMVLRAEDILDMTTWIKEIAKGIDIGKIVTAAEAEVASARDLEDSEVAVDRPENAQIQTRGDVSKLMWSHVQGAVLLVGRTGIEMIRPNIQDPNQSTRVAKSVHVTQVGKANATITSCTNNDELIVLGMSDGRVIGIDARQFVVSWQVKCSQRDILCLCFDELPDGDVQLWCGGVDGAITLLELDELLTEPPRLAFAQSATPTPEWAPVVAIAVSAGLVWTATFGQVSVCAWDMNTRECVNSVHCTFRVTSLLAHGKEIWAGQGDGAISAFDTKTYAQVGSIVSNASEVKCLVDTGRRVWSMHANGTVRVCQISADSEWGQTTDLLSLLASFPAQNSLVDAVLVPINGFEPRIWTVSSVGSLRVWNAGFPDTRDQMIKKRMADRVSEYTETRTLKVRVVTHNVAEDPPNRDGNAHLRDVWCGYPDDKAIFAEHRGFEDVHHEELAKWLSDRGIDEIDGIVGALELAEYPPQTWIEELKAMEADGTLPGFMSAVQKQAERSARFDVIAIGLQEVEMTGNALAKGVAGRETKMGQDWRKHMNAILEKEGYVCVGGRQLVGLFCAVFIHHNHEKYLRDVHVKVVGCGLGGFAGNKGGIVVKLKLYETELTFVNTHLAAHMGHVSKRNEDFESVADALLPELVAVPAARRAGPLTMKTSAPLIWFGDLNYRIPLEFDHVVDCIDNGKLNEIIPHDQLKQEQAAGRVFVGFTESDIFFPPTYKFRQGVTTEEKPFGDYDRRMKKKSAAKGGGKKPPRVPAYCDRVLWSGPGIRPLLAELTGNHRLGYTSHPVITASDHKPVSHSLLVDAQKDIPHLREKVRAAVLQDVSVEATESRPALQLSVPELDFGAVKFGDPPKKQLVSLTNTGAAAAHFHFEAVAHDGSRRMPPQWLRINPMSGQILPGATHQVRLSMLLNRETSTYVAASGNLNVQLQLCCHRSATVKPVEPELRLYCRAQRSVGVVGLRLADLSRSSFPVRADRHNAVSASPDGGLGAGRKVDASPLELPDEYQIIVDWLHKVPASTRLFVDEGDADESELVQDLLETTGNITTFRGSPNSVADCLLTWLDQLPDAVIPAPLHDDAFDAVQAGGVAGAVSIVKQLASEQKAAVYQMLRLCNSIAPRGIDPVRQWFGRSVAAQEHQRPLVAAATLRRGTNGFGIVMNNDAIVCGGDGHTCDAIPLGAKVVQVGTVSVRDKADIIACIRSVPTDAGVQFTYRYNESAAAQEEQVRGVVQALQAAEIPPQTWVAELAGMEADDSLRAFLDAVASETKFSGSATAGTSRSPSIAQLAEAIAPVLFRPSAQMEEGACHFVQVLLKDFDEKHYL